MVVRSSSSGTTMLSARHQPGAFQRRREEPGLLLALHRAVGAQHVDAALVCALGRAARLGEIVATRFSGR